MKNSLQVAGGVVGAVVGFIATLLILELVGFGNRADPIMSGIVALLVLAPLGAIAGLLLGTALATRLRGGENTGGLLRNSLKAFAVIVALGIAAATFYYIYAVTTATPWLNPNAANPILVFEVRLPAGAALPSSFRDIAIELQTDLNTMPGELRPNQFQRDGDRPVIAGNVELAFRTAHRQLEIKIKGQPDRLYGIGLSAKAPHASELGPWQPNTDGSEIRYRAKWPGQD
ncbi:hypothetical protein [Bradyrhizobium sp. AUGA SZCCT0283]|uniref:hypothetical protein n=1 Tax=Bradyrhizobium sp. AUGA SZCCT0283 TaxID=2807671 RepID=UPI001BA874BB|nr:hypothetical protein [Bradyrhizobium sp. AUGA SZCCT0283]MBR1275260.1 hypothetical protein [Bradyrhizobium sp. AUGA SZCCT0283]